MDGGLGAAYQGLRLGTRAATVIFMYSFSGGVERGATLGEVKRSATTTGNPASVVAEAVELLKDPHLFYVRQQSGKYFFSNQPNLNRILLTRMENIDRREVAGEEEALLRKRAGGHRLKVFPWQTSDSDIPDTPDLKLILLRARDDGVMAAMLRQKGTTPRVNCNTLFFLVALESERSALEGLIRKRLAYEMIQGDKSLSLTGDQQKEVKDGLKKAQDDGAEAVRRAYRQLFIPARDGLKESDLGIPTYGEDRPLDEEVYEKLRLDGEILERIAPLVIRERYLRDQKYVLTEQLAQAGLRTPGEVRVVSRHAWEEGIAAGVKQGLFGLGTLEQGHPVCRYFGKGEDPFVQLASGEVIIRAEVCQVQQEKAKQAPDYETPEIPQDKKTKETQAGGEGLTVTATGVKSKEVELTDQLQRLRLQFTVPKGKVAGLMGVINLLQHRFDHLDVVLTAAGGEMSQQEYEDKIKEAFRQLGIEVREG